ncbi:nitroreductase family protein [uncultured Robinsoniella sp.]|uniref:nitroreductase family protein n=1 Tax=uncultured Robinsoniella sp. TaxID=904190 RepID=UPI00374E2D5D
MSFWIIVFRFAFCSYSLFYNGFFLFAIKYYRKDNMSDRQLCKVENDMPEWFRKGMQAAALAPTAQNKRTI